MGAVGTLGVLNLVPILVMIKSAFLKTYGLKMTLDNLSLKNFAFVFTNRGVLAAVRNSILLALVTCGVCIVVGTAAAYMKVRRNVKGCDHGKMCFSDLCHSRYRSFSGNDLPLGRAASRDPSGSIRNHMDPGDRLYNQISDPSDQREHHSSYVCEPGTGRSSTCLWQRQKSSLAAGIASYAGTSYFIRFLFDLCIITYRTYFVIYACKCRNKDHRNLLFLTSCSLEITICRQLCQL